MIVKLYGKDNCKKCDAAKDKLAKMKIKYEYHDALVHSELHDGWRENHSVEFKAVYSHTETLPVLVIDGKGYSYNEAMKELKQRSKK